jgi:hypothetical protein
VPDPLTPPVVIKVTTDDPDHSYYVHFDRNSHALIAVREYKTLYTPLMGAMAPRTKRVVETARTQLKAPETLGVKQ